MTGMEDRRPSRLWRRMPEPARRRAAAALWMDEEAVEQRVEAESAIARHMHFRPKTVQGLDRDRKARYLAGILNLTDSLAGRLLVSYHLAHARPMMATFLDSLGIAHENALITPEDLKAPERARLLGAARALTRAHPADAVRLYFSTLLWQDPETWGGLADLPDTVWETAGQAGARAAPPDSDRRREEAEDTENASDHPGDGT
jgi:hypothetical protein